jgi:hypothetical protein
MVPLQAYTRNLRYAGEPYQCVQDFTSGINRVDGAAPHRQS